MIAALIGKVLSWLAGKGFLIVIQEALEAIREERIRRDYEEALAENARHDAEARERAGQDATRERMRNVETDPSVLAIRERMRNRDPGTR